VATRVRVWQHLGLGFGKVRVWIDNDYQQVLTRLLDIQGMVRLAPIEAFMGEEHVNALVPCSW
jgi:hypothetical protein